MPSPTLLAAVVLAVGTLLATTASAQSDATSPPTAKLVVGVAELPPLSRTTPEGFHDGLAVQLWETVAERADLTYDYRSLALEEATEALRAGEVDIYLTAAPATGSLDTTPHSPIYFSSNLAVASRGGTDFVAVVKGLFQADFFKIVVALSILLLVVGVIIYLVERKPNEEQFGGRPLEGIGAGFWWAGVTLTTIGYGDKAPVSFWGRVVAMLWMLVGLAVSATLTAALVSLVDGGAASLSLPGDLRDGRTVVAEGHPLIPFLERHGVAYETAGSLDEALALVEAKHADHVVANEMELQEAVSGRRNTSLSVQSSRLEPNYFALGFRQNLPQADTISRLVREVTTATVWPDWLEQYTPRG